MKNFFLHGFVFGSYLFTTLSAAPKITGFKWGEITVLQEDGKEVTFNDSLGGIKDCAIGGPLPEVCAWDWKESGTCHNPGITKKAVEKILLGTSPATVVILSRGVHSVLQTTQEAKDLLKTLKKEEKIKEFYIEQSEKAVTTYNRLVDEGEHVVGLFHSTC